MSTSENLTKKDRILHLLKGGLSKNEIVQIVGCHEAYVRAVKLREKYPERPRAYTRKYYWRNKHKGSGYEHI